MDEEFDLGAKKIWQRPKFWIVSGLAVLFLVFLVFGGRAADENSVLGNFSASVFQTFEDIFGFKSEKPIYELDLTTKEGGDLVQKSDSEEKSSKSETAPTLEDKKFSNEEGASQSEVSSVVSKKDNPGSKGIKSENKKETPATTTPAPTQSSNQVRDCGFSLSSPPAGGLSRKVYFNEIAWMGSETSASDEWLEISGESNFSLRGWQIKNEDESLKIIFGEGEKISSNGFSLLERTDDNSVLNVAADKFYVGALSNTGEWLKLFDSNCGVVDEINSKSGWESFGGDNEAKKTLERNVGNFGWHTSVSSGGTPKARNSEPTSVIPPPATSTPPASPPQEPTSTPPVTPPAEETPPPLPPPVSVPPIVLITEVMAGAEASSDYEFVEIYNAGSEAVNLTGWSIKKKSSSGAESSLVVASRLEGKSIPPGKYFLIAHDGGYTGGVTADVLWPASYSLAYTNNTVTIYNASGAIIDQVSWAEIPKDKAYARSGLNISAGFGLLDVPTPQNSQ